MNFFESHPIHYFILSPSGKPIFSYREDSGSSSLALFALVRALHSKVESVERIQGSNGVRFVFIQHSELLFVSLTHSHASQPHPEDVLDLLYKHVLFHVTKPGLRRDLNALLGGTEMDARALLGSCEVELGVAVDAVQSFACGWDIRRAVLEGLEEARRDLAHVAFVVARDGAFVTGVGPAGKRNKYGNAFASKTDCVLIAHFVKNARAASSGVETWTPICLPEFDDTGHFHAYCALVAEGLYVVFLTTDSSLERFHLSSTRRRQLQERCKNEFAALSESLAESKHELVLDEFFNDEPPNSPSRTGLLHVAVKVVSAVSGAKQFVETKHSGQFNTYSPQTITRELIVTRYGELRRLAFNDESSTNSLNVSTASAMSSSFLSTSGIGGSSKDNNDSETATRVIFDSNLVATALYAKEADVEFYCLFRPFTSVETCTQTLNKLKSVVSKQHRPTLFFASSLYYR